MDCYLRSRLYLSILARWLLGTARFLLWCLVTGCLAVGTAWTGRSPVLTEWLVLGPPAWRGPDRREVVVALEAARGVAAMESWLRAGCPPRAPWPGTEHRTGQPDASD